MTLVVPVPAGPPLSSASSPWRCSFPVPCFVPAEPGPRPCPPHAPLSAPRAASYTPACNRKRHTDTYGSFRCWLTKSAPVLPVDWKLSEKQNKSKHLNNAWKITIRQSIVIESLCMREVFGKEKKTVAEERGRTQVYHKTCWLNQGFLCWEWRWPC